MSWWARRIAWWLFMAIAGLVILGVSIVRSTMAVSEDGSLVRVAARGVGMESARPSVTEVPTPTVKPQVNYTLVYPGILPDHFLYPVKMTRDKLRLWFTFGNLKKANLLVMYADKRLGAARVLVEGGKVKLGVRTAGKGEKYLERAFAEIAKAERKGQDAIGYWEKLNTAAMKHIEVMEEVSELVVPENKGEWNKAVDYAKMVRDLTAQKLRELKG